MNQVRYTEADRIYVMMIDIDRFKQINDNYGHSEGDRALIIVSEALKRTCEGIKAPVFLGRYGGDEFTMILQDPGKNEQPDQVTNKLRTILSEKCQENNLPYALDVSIGYDMLKPGDDSLKDCMNRADKKLYREKREKAAAR